MKSFGSMKSAVLILCAAMLCGCTAVESTGKCAAAAEAKCQQKKLKAGFFVGDGSNGSGIFYWARLLDYSREIDVTLLEGEDIRNGALNGLDLLVVPGGSSERQYKNVQEAGAEKIREFVKNGGSYVGICAGFHCTLNKPTRFRLAPYTYRVGAGGERARTAININEMGAKVLDIKPGRYYVRYSHGPISTEVNEWEHGRVDTLGVYRSTVSRIGKPSDFMNSPAIIYGNYGKGKLVATSFHPESHRQNDPISMGCIYAVTGVKPTLNYPEKVYRPIRVAFVTTHTVGKAPIRQLLELDREKELDVRLMDDEDLGVGMLLHTDVVVIPDANAKAKMTRTLKTFRKDFEKFLARGGRIVVGEKLAEFFGGHKNVSVVPSGSSFVKEVLKRP